MDRIAFEIFEPDKKQFRLTPNWIMLFVFLFTTGFFWLFDSSLPLHGAVRSWWIAIVFILYLSYLIASFFKHKPLKGRLSGKIEFEKERVVVNRQAFELKDINSLDFALSDYYELSSTAGIDLNGRLSQGVSNYITFKDNTDQTHLIYFQLPGRHSYLSLSDFINEAIRTNKISSYKGNDLIGAENVQT